MCLLKDKNMREPFVLGLFLLEPEQLREEIIEELRARQVQLSPSEVGYLGRKFVAYLALAHRQSAPGLQQAMRAQGGYILDLDGTTGGGGPMLMSSLDSLSEIVPGNVRRSGNGCASTA